MRLIGFFILIASLISGCHQQTPANTLIVGTLAGPETELVQVAQKIALERYGLTVKIVEFNDYNLPNEALNDGSLDANVYQHMPYLDATNQAHGYRLIPISKTFLYPVGLYSKRIKTVKKLPQHATIALPNDPSNEARALMLLQQAHLITLKPNKKAPNTHDVLTNPHDLQFKVLDAAQLPRVLPDVDAAVINTTFALPAGLSPSRDALIIENKDSPYANIIAVQENSPKKEQIELFIKAFQSDDVKEKAKQLFGDAAIPAWQ